MRRLGWRIYSTNQPQEELSLEQAVLAYRNEYLVERSLGRLKGRPLSLTPMYVQRDDHATGLIRLLSIALRVLTLLDYRIGDIASLRKNARNIFRQIFVYFDLGQHTLGDER